jgi:hypothetical protein
VMGDGVIGRTTQGVLSPITVSVANHHPNTHHHERSEYSPRP